MVPCLEKENQRPECALWGLCSAAETLSLWTAQAVCLVEALGAHRVVCALQSEAGECRYRERVACAAVFAGRPFESLAGEELVRS